MKKILLFSLVLAVTGNVAMAQDKVCKKSATCRKKTEAAEKTTAHQQERLTVPKKNKGLSLHATKVQPATVPAELRDERAN